ncbi:glycosyltransferase, partial [Listeria monocytogenes]|nr:glycosyltransferase [Listeria monocytogenes]
MKQCPVCENYTIEANYDICEVCYWEYDVVAQEYPDEIIGANNISLKQAKI